MRKRTRNAAAVSSNPSRVTIETPLVRNNDNGNNNDNNRLNCVAYSISSVAETRDKALSFF